MPKVTPTHRASPQQGHHAHRQLPCGKIVFRVDAELVEVMECNCSHCSRKGYLLWFIPRGDLEITAGEGEYLTYEFNKHVIRHHFCPVRRCAPFATGKAPPGADTAAVNVRWRAACNPLPPLMPAPSLNSHIVACVRNQSLSF